MHSVYTFSTHSGREMQGGVFKDVCRGVDERLGRSGRQPDAQPWHHLNIVSAINFERARIKKSENYNHKTII